MIEKFIKDNCLYIIMNNKQIINKAEIKKNKKINNHIRKKEKIYKNLWD
jgi:hypothetical protein